MQRFMTFFMVMCLGLTLSLDANAKRMGSGKSFGSAPSHQASQTKQAAPASAAAPAAGMAGKAAAAGGMSRWLGPLAGLAAGGLLASMFMGGGFEGLQIMDMLIMALIAFLAFRFIASRRKQQAQTAQPATAGGVPYQREATPAAPAANNIFGGAISSVAAKPVIKAPAWFNESSFINAGREHFLSLQQHWDVNEMDKLEEFTTPQLLTFLRQERASLGDAFQSTYIDDLDVQLDGLDDQADKTIATLTFSGIEKSSRFDQGEAFSESWRMERLQGDNQPWLIAGMRQN
jgi:predicted lipid-binding transport protein (Tim44 family)